MADGLVAPNNASSVGSAGPLENGNASKAMVRGKNFNRYNVIPLSFKGDGIGYTAGYGYN